MPKIKTNSSAAKRFSRTASGGYKCAHSHLNHILTKKSTKRKRNLRPTAMISASDVRAVRQMMPYTL